MKLLLIAQVKVARETNWHVRFKDLKRFYEENGRLPKMESLSYKPSEWEKSLHAFLTTCCRSKTYIKEVANWALERDRKEKRWSNNWEIRFEDLKRFYKEKGRLPSIINPEDYEEKSLGDFLAWGCKEPRLYEVAEWAFAHGRQIQLFWQVRFEGLKQFYEDFGRIPKPSKNTETNENLLYSFMIRTKHPEVLEWARAHGKKTITWTNPGLKKSWQERFEDLKQFYEDFGRLPKDDSENSVERALGIFMTSRCKKEKFIPEIAEWAKAHGRSTGGRPWQLTFQDLKQFYEDFGRLPKINFKDKKEKSLAEFMSAYQKIPEIAEWVKARRFIGEDGKDISKGTRPDRPWQERFEELKQFYRSEGRMPLSSSNSDKESFLGKFLKSKLSGNYPVREIKDWYYQNSFKDIKEFFNDFGYLPKLFSEDPKERALSGFKKWYGINGPQEFRDWCLSIKNEINRRTVKKPSNEHTEYKNDNHIV